MTLDWTALTCRGWSSGDRCMQTRFTENEGWDPGMAPAIFRLSSGAYLYRCYRVKSRESTRSLIALGSWQAWIEELDRGTGCLLPKIGDEGRGESACIAPQGITGKQPASHPLVVVELDMTVDPRLLCGADYASVKA
jgi:hypothetical protein